MKKLSINSRILAIALATIFSVGFLSPAFAIDDEKKTIPVALKFIGNIENQPVFELAFTNADENEYTVIVRDEYNTVLYRDNVKGNVTKKFMLNIEDLGNTGVQFEITGKKSDKTVIYEVNKQSRFIEDVVINKMK